MKYLKYIGVFFLFFLSSCEEVIDVDLETGDSTIVIDAEILWEKGTDGNLQTIRISRMTDYYNPEPPKVSGAQVYIENSRGDLFTFNESDETGVYVCDHFLPQLNNTYTLEVTVGDHVFSASETLIPVPEINRVEQDYVNGFSGDKNFEVSIFYNDPENQTNFYLTHFKAQVLQYPEYILADDDFFNGNEIENNFSDEDLEVGDTVEIIHRGVSEQFYNYMNLVLETTSSNPFATPPANIRGNIINQNNPEEYVLGYFRLCEANHLLYNLEEE
ncbi:DUF4249 domain-containing protein [Flavivirga sp. 57AJ16]|uniref:DUF4249 domain-containing protein n=1 Tax=Flavivirga sp. 57AJ16 TaxID=3025307 RepID=UPI002365662E|nr:DUF4249 domain-containing protein [Flavivirga sp. 57AJ16]